MRCPACSADDTRVVDSRPAADGAAVRRRRGCERCGFRFTTYERMEIAAAVRKRDGSLQPFDAEKARRGIERALADRPLPRGVVDELVRRVEATAAAAKGEVAYDDLAHVILAGLRDIDEVAYLRFASVYKDFQGVRDFEREVAALEDR